MKNSIVFIFLLSVVITSCSKEEKLDDIDPVIESENNKMLMLKIDYSTLVFEEGIELNFNSLGTYDSIPLDVHVNEAGDFGDVTITHVPTIDTVFFGTVVWAGLGERIFPETMSPASSFELNTEPSTLPENYSIKLMNSYGAESLAIIDFESIWNTISNLESVANYMENDVHFALLQYAPSIGVGDPEEWDWYLMIYQ